MRVSGGKAAASIEAVKTAVADIEDQLDLLEQRVARLHGEWDGDAREAFATAMREWDESVRALRVIANDAARIAAGSVARFDAFDRRRAGAWRR